MGRLNSTTWSYFTKLNDKIAECNLCKKHVKTSGNTTNAKNHLKTRHGIYIIGNSVLDSDRLDLKSFRTDDECQKAIEKIPAFDDENMGNFEETRESFTQQISEKEEEVEESTEMYMVEDDDEISIEETEVYHQPKTVATTYVLKQRQQESASSVRVQQKVNSTPPPPSAPKTTESSSSIPRYDFSSAVDLFFASMAATVKQMPADKIVAIKQKISRIVFEEELKQITASTLEYIQSD
ncbi:hypothetical protein DMENIID0001_068300 [Sergentomyia squamirostris]